MFFTNVVYFSFHKNHNFRAMAKNYVENQHCACHLSHTKFHQGSLNSCPVIQGYLCLCNILTISITIVTTAQKLMCILSAQICHLFTYQVSLSIILKIVFWLSRDYYISIQFSCEGKKKLEDLQVLKRSPDLLNNVKIGQGQLRLIIETYFVLPHMGVAAFLVK